MTTPWSAADGGIDVKRHAPATLRNRDVIADVLRDVLPPSGLVLEIASGSGEHVMYFARIYSHLNWLPSDPDADALQSIAAWSAESGLPNILAPVALDASQANWAVAQADAIICINMVHISPWDATVGLMNGAGRMLARGGLLYLYGPFIQKDVETAPDNVQFDANLRERNPHWGLRDVEEVAHCAAERGLLLKNVVTMPANNLSLIFSRS